MVTGSEITNFTLKVDMFVEAAIVDIQFVGPTVKKYDSKEQLMAQKYFFVIIVNTDLKKQKLLFNNLGRTSDWKALSQLHHPD